mgnify:CR=1 FL=1
MFSLFSIRPLMPTVKNVLSPTNFHNYVYNFP